MDYRQIPGERVSTAVPVIILINIVVFLLWLSISGEGEESSAMTENFLVSWNHLIKGRPWTLITSVFSHNLFWHLFLNMYVLGSFGEIVEDALGSWRFCSLYFSAGMISSFSHSMISAYVLKQPELPALGASGAISGIMIFFALLFPRERIFFFGIIPIPALWGALTLVGIDLWGLIQQAEGAGIPIGHGAHLGGALTGAIYFFWSRLHHSIGAGSFRRHQWQ